MSPFCVYRAILAGGGPVAVPIKRQPLGTLAGRPRVAASRRWAATSGRTSTPACRRANPNCNPYPDPTPILNSKCSRAQPQHAVRCASGASTRELRLSCDCTGNAVGMCEAAHGHLCADKFEPPFF
eukprot:6197704-Pleurochrysis_carterae.AAC.6